MLHAFRYSGGMTTFGQWLAGQIEERNLSGLRFARKLQVSHTTVQAWINDKREPSRDDLYRIAAALDLPSSTVGLAFLGLLGEQITTRNVPEEVRVLDAVGELAEVVNAQVRAAMLDWLEKRYGSQAREDVRDRLDDARRTA
jgi:transcriptional regulator with XRE-family HTH domain